ncbi:MAG TPA: peptide chain release factor N(5)-glutamine methyltransferase [Candidatus Lumbricidophila sp.]|nr:peptide chain release factor N(5)-glutamine methyltransferase [Candidatus Lumbricidophila sp.]
MRALVAEITAQLEVAGVPDAPVDAELLIGHMMGWSRGQVQANAIVGAEISSDASQSVRALAARRAAREPLQHLTGLAPFRSLELEVGPGVFVPRPETELVAGLAIDALRDAAAAASAAAGPHIAVDLGTGSGAIALAVASEVPSAAVWAVEREPAAHAWAARNVLRTGVTNLTLVLGDLGTALTELDGSVDVVVSNPPYIPDDAVPIDPEVQLFDPPTALYGGRDGLDVVRVLSVRAAQLLKPGGVLLIEHGERQASDIAALLSVDGWQSITCARDLTGRDRVTRAVHRPGPAGELPRID